MSALFTYALVMVLVIVSRSCVCVCARVSATARVGLMHIGVFILLLLSGERNFGVRLNKPYSVHVPMDIPVFTGTHADLLIVVRLCHTSYSRLQHKYRVNRIYLC